MQEAIGINSSDICGGHRRRIGLASNQAANGLNRNVQSEGTHIVSEKKNLSSEKKKQEKYPFFFS